MASEPTRTLRRYYERTTGLFLRLSGGQSTHSLHRPVWAPEVTSQAQAFAYPYRLVLQAAEDSAVSSDPARDEPLRVLDLGCGVGGGILYLLDHLDRTAHGTGITISPTQVERARRSARASSLDPAEYTFLEADFHDLPPVGPVDVVFAIEAFALAARPWTVLEEVTRVLRPGGQLVLIDDFFARPSADRQLSPTEQNWVETVRSGWHAHGLRAVSTVTEHAQEHDLTLQKNENLTSFLPLGRPRDLFIEWCIVPLRSVLWRWPYFRGLIAGDALQNCLDAGIIEYRHLVFERDPAS